MSAGLKLITPKAAAEMLNISVKTLQKLCREGKLGFVQVDGKRRMFTVEHLQRYVESRTVEPRLAKSAPGRVSSPVKRGGDERAKKSLRTSRASLREEMKSWR